MTTELKDPEFHARLTLIIGDDRPFSWAAKVGLSKGAFSRIWNDGTTPSPDLLRKIYTATGVSLTWLLTGEGPMRHGTTDAEPTLAAPPAPQAMAEHVTDVVNIHELLNMTAEVLVSDTVYRPALAANIKAFHRSINLEQDNQKLMDRVAKLEQRLEEMDKRLSQTEAAPQKVANG